MHLTDQEHIDELESALQQAQGHVIDVCTSAKKILLAYMGYQEGDLGPEIQHIHRMAAEYEAKSDTRPGAREWWNKVGLRKDISKWSEAERMQWAYNQGLNA